MSILNDVVILGSVLETDKQLNCINNWLQHNGHRDLVRFKDCVETPITKSERVFTSFLAIGCFNYLDMKKFIKFLKNDVDWEYPDLVRILIDNECFDDGYKLYKIED